MKLIIVSIAAAADDLFLAHQHQHVWVAAESVLHVLRGFMRAQSFEQDAEDGALGLHKEQFTILKSLLAITITLFSTCVCVYVLCAHILKPFRYYCNFLHSFLSTG